MSSAYYLYFNLILNGAFSFFAGLVIVFLSIRIFRIGNSRWKLFFLSLPFAKIVWDFLQGIPSSSFVYTGIDPLSLPPKHGLLEIGFGFSQYGPILTTVLNIQDLAGKKFSISLPDFLAVWLSRNITPEFPKYALLGLLLVSISLCTIRIFSIIRFEIRRRVDRRSLNSKSISEATVFGRSIDIYESSSFTGSPFTGGILNPFICVPSTSLKMLNQTELNAVIQHEIAHLKYFDLPVSILIKFIGDTFWFIPFYKYLSMKIDRLREILADKTAVQMGASGLDLASALIKLKEMPRSSPVLYSAFIKERSLLKTRIDYLETEFIETRSARFGWNNAFVRLLIAFWTSGGVFLAKIGGNHQVSEPPAWLLSLLKTLGLV